MGNILIIENTGFCDDGCEFIITWHLFIGVILFILIGIFILIYYVYRRKQRQQNIIENNELLPSCENKIVNPSEMNLVKQIEIQCDIYLHLIPTTRSVLIDSIDIYARPIVEINQPIDQIILPIEEQKLICYCDGSYSHFMQIGVAGFRASNGAYRIRFFSPHEPRYGSTNTEVLAAYLAIQYALEEQYPTLIIYTDNSKVEQLLKCPKKKDNINYPDVCQIMNQYKKQKGDHAIEIIRVRGHTTISEQRTCKIKHEFAKIDRTVRRKMRQYIKRYWIQFKQNYYHWYKPVRRNHRSHNQKSTLHHCIINVERGYQHRQRNWSYQWQ